MTPDPGHAPAIDDQEEVRTAPDCACINTDRYDAFWHDVSRCPIARAGQAPNITCEACRRGSSLEHGHLDHTGVDGGCLYAERGKE